MAGLFVGMTSRPLRLSLSTWLSGYRPEDASEDVGYQLVRVCSGSDALAPPPGGHCVPRLVLDGGGLAAGRA